MQHVIGDARHPPARVQHHLQRVQQHLARAFHGQPAVFLDLAVLHFEQAVALDDQIGVLEVAVDKYLAVQNHALPGEGFPAYRLHLYLTFYSVSIVAGGTRQPKRARHGTRRSFYTNAPALARPHGVREAAGRMRLCRFDTDRVGVLRGDKVVDVTSVLDSIPAARWPIDPGDLLITNF